MVKPQVVKKKLGKTKPQECSYLPTILAFHHKPDGTYSRLTVHFEAVITEVPSYIVSTKAESQTMVSTRSQTFCCQQI